MVIQLWHPVQQILQSVLQPLCCLTAWIGIGLGAWQIGSALHHGIVVTRRLHRIPCANCRFFTGNYHLKCAVHPDTALSDSAINCTDFITATRQVMN